MLSVLPPPEERSLSVVAAIPARYNSQRFPGKPLAQLRGKPLVQHVWERAREAACFARVVILTDDRRIWETARAFGAEVEMTPVELPSGTDRIAWAARHWNCLGVVNVQGDEPLVNPEDLARVASELLKPEAFPIVTLAAKAEPEDQNNPNVVKVVWDRFGRALYFSRASIPYPRNQPASPLWKHVGVYGYRLATLLCLATLEATPLERTESLEQLRALENGIPIQVLPGAHPSIGVDTPEDLARLERLFDTLSQGEKS